MAQLVARFHGMEEARGSNPLSSTTANDGEFGLFHVRPKQSQISL